MRRSIIIMSAVLAAASAAPGTGSAWATPADDLKERGFVEVKSTTIVGDFEGCERDRKITLAAGGVFTCSGFGYMHARNPKAVLLKSKDGRQYKLVVQGAVFDGSFA